MRKPRNIDKLDGKIDEAFRKRKMVVDDLGALKNVSLRRFAELSALWHISPDEEVMLSERVQQKPSCGCNNKLSAEFFREKIAS